MRRFDLPAGTEAGEVAGFVALRLEELSPFPLDQLHSGYLRSADGTAVFVYAAYRRRLPAGQAESWNAAPFVLPDFAPALTLRFPASTVVLMRSAASLTALYFDVDRDLPVRAAARALPPEADGETFAAVRRAVLGLVQAGPAREVQFEVAGPPQQRAQGLTFPLTGESRAEDCREVVIATGDCWTMDVRDPEFVAAQRKRLGVDLLFWRVVQGAVAAMLLLVLGEMLVLAGSGYSAWLQRRFDARQPDVLALEDKNALTLNLRQFRERALHPFEMFRVLGRGRPATLYFTEARLDGFKMEISGEASNMAEFNSYMAALRAMPELDGPPDEGSPKVQGTITVFKIVVKFKPGVFAVAQQASTP
ncbi:MAG: hypothetical protein IAE82_08020 [Opitutaceae bacterium]|nr:hypothetical protein [Opitutaceae bacterium]